MSQGPIVNMDQLRAWLADLGFDFGNQFRDQMNECDWYAWRRSKLDARDCDCNEGRMQIVLTPYACEHDDTRWESVEVDVTGECDGVWYKLQAYSMTPAELVARLDDVEAALIRAWNSLAATGRREGER